MKKNSKLVAVVTVVQNSGGDVVAVRAMSTQDTRTSFIQDAINGVHLNEAEATTFVDETFTFEEHAVTKVGK